MKAFAWGLAGVLLGLAVLEIGMQPSWAERLELALIFVLMAASMATAARWLPSVARRYRSIRITVAVLALAAFSIVVLGALAVGNRMFLSSHDLTLLLVVIAFGIVSAVGFALAVSGPLTEDLNLLSTSADLVAKGELTQELTLDRQDEIGRLSRSLDRMVTKLESAESSRQYFFAAVGHDLRTPISSIRAAVEAIQDGVAENPTDQMATIERDIEVLTNLVEDVYLLARLDAGNDQIAREPVDVSEVADETLEILMPLANQKEIELKLTSSRRVVAYADPLALGRVFRNLADNAVRHAPSRSVVTVKLDDRGDRVVAEISDEGTGFDPDFVGVAFDRFTRSESDRGRATGGSGLGLAIARDLVEAMGGSIWIEPGGGGKVGFDLEPDRRERPDQAAPRRRTSSLRPA